MDIGVVIVTYNRIEKLMETLNQFSRQTKSPLYVMIVNNASTDQTEAYLESWQREKENFDKIILNLSENTGGSGGFYEGLKKSLSLSAEWVWVSDDDAMPEVDALETAYCYLEKEKEHLDEISAICGQVINDGEIDTNHRKNYTSRGIRILEQPVPEEKYAKEEFEINAFSYVGTIISRDKMKKVGVTLKEYFIWWDDTEHSLRLSKVGRIICVPGIRIHHDVGRNNFEVSWKTYYGFRNMADMYRRHMPRRCFAYFSLRVIGKVILFSIVRKNVVEITLLRKAFFDAIKGEFGIDPIYKPGWKNNA
ncbi:glycosyltransferase [Lacrimispora sp.]|jgi:GT2 family glycosyltransferase|uniref:glycosyltransferase n=1 Tax=Lacrimispora sp. TaxID=2719234 RepID=UPI0028A9AE8A|nr:glycosyltransferase [Lacrimispora sp.]